MFTITDSEFLKEQLIQNGYPASKIAALRLPPPSHIEATTPPSIGIPRFVFLGRVEANKGVDWLIRSAARAKTPIHIDVVGDGTKLELLRSLAARLGMMERVTFHGWHTGDSALDLLRGCRALIVPSVWHEPGATVAVEAMAAGRAIIMSRVGGMTEVILGERSGLLVQPNDVAGLAQAIECLALDWDKAAKMGAAGRALVEEKYSMAKHMETLTKLYHRVRELHGSNANMDSNQTTALT
jgi:glycosyltransferase involved in cell wall biosynthesis